MGTNQFDRAHRVAGNAVTVHEANRAFDIGVGGADGVVGIFGL